MYIVNWFLDHVIASGLILVGMMLLFFPLGNLGRLAMIFSLMKWTPRNSIGGLQEGIVAFEGNAFAVDEPILDERGESCAYLSVNYQDNYAGNAVVVPSPFFLVGDETGTVAVKFRRGLVEIDQRKQRLQKLEETPEGQSFLKKTGIITPVASIFSSANFHSIPNEAICYVRGQFSSVITEPRYRLLQEKGIIRGVVTAPRLGRIMILLNPEQLQKDGFQFVNRLISMALGLLLMALGTYIRKTHQGS